MALADPLLAQPLLQPPREPQQEDGGLFDISVPFGVGGIGLVGFNPVDMAEGAKKNKFSLARLRLLSSDVSIQEDGGECFHKVSQVSRTMSFGQLVMFTYLAAAGGPCVTPPSVNTVSWC